MKAPFKVSVIIPVFKAEKFLRKAVMSAIELPQVSEVLLIEDNSPDNSLEICKQLQDESSKVKIFQHPNRENRGAGATRNLGLRNAQYEYIAFLDADDWYLPNRFNETEEIFRRDQSIDGVYGAVGTFFEEEHLNYLGKVLTKEVGEKRVTYFKKTIRPDDLFSEMLTMSNGTFHTNGITLRRSLIEKTGGFNEKLRLHQDSEMWVRCSYFGKLVGLANAEPVAIRGVHRDNRIQHIGFSSKALYYSALYDFFKDRQLRPEDRKVMERKYINYHPSRKFHDAKPLINRIEKLFFWLKLKVGRSNK